MSDVTLLTCDSMPCVTSTVRLLYVCCTFTKNATSAAPSTKMSTTRPGLTGVVTHWSRNFARE